MNKSIIIVFFILFSSFGVAQIVTTQGDSLGGVGAPSLDMLLQNQITLNEKISEIQESTAPAEVLKLIELNDEMLKQRNGELQLNMIIIGLCLIGLLFGTLFYFKAKGAI